MVICVGAKGAGKTFLLKTLCDPDSISLDTFTLPTVGVNIFSYPVKKNLKQKGKKPNSPYLDIRELGGELVPIWDSYLNTETNLIFVIDTQAISQVSLVCVKLSESLARLEENLASLNQVTRLCIVWTKLDRAEDVSQSIRQLRTLMRLNSLVHHSPVNVTEVQFNTTTGGGLNELEAWLLSTIRN